MTSSLTQALREPASSQPAPFQTHDDPSWRARILNGDEFPILVATAAVVVAAALVADGFLTTENLLSIAQQIALLGIVATGMTYVVVVGEIDLSVGSQYGFLAVVLAWLVRDVGVPIGPALPLVIVAGTAIGALNGFLTTRFALPSFVVTLAMLSVLRGAALLLSGGVPLRGSTNPTFQAATAGQPLPGLTAQTLWMVGVMVTFGLVLGTTKFGSDILSVGGNERAAGNAGIDVARTKIACFAIVGGLSGVAAAIVVGWLGNANPLTGTGFELSVIAAVVVGGASLSGGKGTVIGTLLGAVITGVLGNALVLAGVDGNWQQVATGVLILVAVLLNSFVARRSRRSRTA